VELTVPLTDPKREIVVEGVTDLVNKHLLQEGPLVQNKLALQPEVKDKQDDSDAVLKGLGFQLPYEEHWDTFPMDDTQGTEPFVSPTGSYYRSQSGLSPKEIRPFLLVPSTMAANSRSYALEGGSVVTKSFIRRVKLPSRKLLSPNAALAVQGEAVLRHFSSLDEWEPDRKLYFRNLKVLRFMIATWDALMFGYQVVRTVSTSASFAGQTITWRVGSDLRRQIERLRLKLILQPYKTAKELKELAGHARAWFFGSPKPKQPLLRTIPSKYYGLMFLHGQSSSTPGHIRHKGRISETSR